MKYNKRNLLLVLLVLLAAMLACTTLSRGEEETPTEAAGDAVQVEPSAPAATEAGSQASEGQVEQPAATAEETTPSSQPGADEIDLSDPSWYVPQDWMISYSLEGKYTYSGVDSAGVTVAGSVNLAGLFDVANQEFAFTFSPEGDLNAEMQSPFSIASVEGVEYYASGAELGCITMENALDSSGMDDLFDQDLMLDGTAKRILPDEEVNGREVFVYALTAENVNVDPLVGGNFGEISEGKIYLDKEKGYAVGMWFRGTGEVELFTEEPLEDADIYYELYFDDINEPVNIQVPEGCSSEGGGEYPFPLLGGATDVTSMGGSGISMVNFTVNLTLEEAMTAYQTTLEAAGYSLGDTMSFGDIANQEYTHPSGNIIVNYSKATSGEGTTITVLQQ